MSATCPRLFEVEALRDGRLTGPELVRFQGHLATCSVCAREAEALQALSDALRSETETEADADELHVRRERTRLLAAFDERLVPAPRALRPELWLAAAFGLTLMVLAAFVLWPARPAPRAAVPSPPDPITIRADSSARWSRSREASVDHVVLESGALSIRVDHVDSQRRLLVSLPDGELEDIGTTFSVSAAAGHTTRVTVQDGSVVLRLHGSPPIALGAGDAWSPPPVLPATVPPPPAAAPSSAPLPRPAPSTKHALTVESEADPSADFRAAMAALNSGDNASAAARFAAFSAQHPQNARAEDAAYLRALACQRAGNSSATRQAARDYLARYPRGFRRAEAEALAH